MHYRQTLALGVGLALALPAAAAAEDWLGRTEPPSRFNMSVGADEDGGSAVALGADLPFAGSSRFYLDLQRDEFADGEKSDYVGIGIGSDPYADTVVRLDGAVHGERDVAEFRDLQLGVTRYTGNWDFRVRGVVGRVEVDAADGGTGGAPGFFGADDGSDSDGQVESDRAGLGLGAGYLAGPTYLSIEGIRYAYDWEDGDEPEPLLFQSRSQRTLRHAATVPEWEAAAGMAATAGAWDWKLRYHASAATDSERFDSVVFGGGYQTAEGHRLGVTIDVPTDDGPAYGQLELGVAL